MVEDIKHKIYLRPIEATLPEPDAAPYRCIQLNEDWISLVLGLLSFMQWRFMWEGTEEQKDLAAQQFEKFMGIMNGECSVITDIRIEGNELQKQVCGSETWETVGEFPAPEPVEPIAPEMRVFDGFIQWKASNEATWHDLIALEDLRGADGTNGEDAPIPVFEWDGYTLKIDANADGTFDVTSPSLRGATGGNGTNAPVPVFEWDGYQLKIDANADGTFDVTSPSLQGATGSGEDAPIPVFEWDGYQLKIDANADGTFDVTSPSLQGAAGSDAECSDCPPALNQIYEVAPPVTDTDKYCYAAHQLAGELIDDYKDTLQVISTAIAVGTDLVKSAVEALVGWVPAAGTIPNASLEWLTETYDSVVIDYLVDDITDPDIEVAVAEKIYCALLETAPNFEDFLNHINYEDAWQQPILILSGDTQSAVWSNFEILAEIVFNGGLSKLHADMILAFAKASKFAQGIANNVGIIEPWDKGIKNMLNNAAFFDSRDCSGYGCVDTNWEQYFDLTDDNGGFTAISAEGGVRAFWETVTGWFARKDTLGCNCSELRIHRPSLDSEAIVTHIEIGYSADSDVLFDFNYDSSAQRTLGAGNDLLEVFDCDVPIVQAGQHCVVSFYHGDGQPDIELKTLRLSGTGVNPFAEV